MKITKYILAAIGTFALAACNKDTVHLDTKSIPAKVVECETYGLYSVSDGLAHFATLSSPLFFSVIKRDGSVVMSDSLFYAEKGLASGYYCFQNNSNEFFCLFSAYPQLQVALAKFDKDYHLAYFHDYGIEGGCAKAALDNGNFAFFSKEYSEADNAERVAMRIINNDGELEEYMVYLEDGVDDGFFDISGIYDYNFFSYGNRLIVTYSDMTGSANYRIYNIDGTYVNSGMLECVEGESWYVNTIRYSAGNLYIMNEVEAASNIPCAVAKIDADGNKVFTTTVHAAYLSKNVFVKDGVLVVAASCFLNDDDESKTVDRLFLIDDNSGMVKDSIAIDYDGSLNVKLILPAYDGCYDVFTSRSKDDKSNAIHIFHTDDLHNLQSLNQ